METHTTEVQVSGAEERAVVVVDGLTVTIRPLRAFFREHLSNLRALPIEYRVATSAATLTEVSLTIADPEQAVLRRTLWRRERWGSDRAVVEACYTWEGACFVQPDAPRALLRPGVAYTIRIEARDGDGRRAQATVTLDPVAPFPTRLGSASSPRLRLVWCLPAARPAREEVKTWFTARLASCPARDDALTLLVGYEGLIAAGDLDGFAQVVSDLREVSAARPDVILIPGMITWETPPPALLDTSQTPYRPRSADGANIAGHSEWRDKEFAPDHEPRLCCITCHNTALVLSGGEVFFAHKFGDAGTITVKNLSYGGAVRQLTLHQLFRPADRPQLVEVGGWRLIVEICMDAGSYKAEREDEPPGHLQLTIGNGGGVNAADCAVVPDGYGLAVDVQASFNRLLRVRDGTAVETRRPVGEGVTELEPGLIALDELLTRPGS